MKPLRIVPDDTKIPFMKWRRYTLSLSALLIVLSGALFFTMGLNLGIDFRGGTLIEIRTQESPADIERLREITGELQLGEVEIQEFGEPDDVLIRIATQEGGEEAQQAAIERVQDALGDTVDYRRIEVVGPRVSGELAEEGTLAVLIALAGILVYLWFRFEWQYAVGAVAATVHDLILTIGILSLLQLDFGLSSIAAILTIVGYSLNDTVVVYDRIREMLRRYKAMALPNLLDLAMNETLGRTLMTSITTLLALFALYFLGGEVIATFTFAMIWGVLVGTYSTAFIAAPILIYLNMRPSAGTPQGENEAEAKAAE